MDLKQAAEALDVPLAYLLTGMKSKPKLRLVKGGCVDKPKKGG